MLNTDIKESRMLPIEKARSYMGDISITTAKKILIEIGAKRNIGRRVVYDRLVIDRYLNELSENK